jgi:hypothetical protein
LYRGTKEEFAKAEYQGEKVTLNKPRRIQGGNKKFEVFVMDGDKVKRVTLVILTWKSVVMILRLVLTSVPDIHVTQQVIRHLLVTGLAVCGKQTLR